MADLVAAEHVRLQEIDVDRYGRFVARVYIGNTYVNKAMIEKGYAWWYRHYAGTELVFWMAQRRAKSAKLGLWAEPHPIPPWELRTDEGLKQIIQVPTASKTLFLADNNRPASIRAATTTKATPKTRKSIISPMSKLSSPSLGAAAKK